VTEYDVQQTAPRPEPERGQIHDGLERAERETYTQPVPKSARAQVRFLLDKAKGSTRALAARLERVAGIRCSTGQLNRHLSRCTMVVTKVLCVW
jgi:hypothetical protein